MQSRNDRVVQWIRELVEGPFREDVSLALLYGSYESGTQGPLSDVDCYFIPRTERAQRLSRSFILEGVGYDLFPMSWERVEGLSRLEEPLLPCLGDARVLFSHSEAERRRFEELRLALARNLADSSYVRVRALERYHQANGLFACMLSGPDWNALRCHAGYLAMFLADAMAYSRHTYFHRGLKRQLADLQALPGVPEAFVEAYLGVMRAEDAAALIASCRALLESVRALLDAPPVSAAPQCPESIPSGRLDGAALAGWYQEVVSTFNKVYACAASGDAPLAFLSAVCLQYTLDEARAWGLAAHEVLTCYHFEDLYPLEARVRDVERQVVAQIEASGTRILRYDSVEALLAGQPQRPCSP